MELLFFVFVKELPCTCVFDHFQQFSTILSIKITHFRARQYHFKILKFCGALRAHFNDLGLHHFLFFNCIPPPPPIHNQLDGLTPLYKVGHWTPRVAILCSLYFIFTINWGNIPNLANPQQHTYAPGRRLGTDANTEFRLVCIAVSIVIQLNIMHRLMF